MNHVDKVQRELADSQAEHFGLLVQVQQQRGLSRQQAIREVARKNPKAHADYIAATQPRTPRFGVPR